MTAMILPVIPSSFWLHARGEGGGADFDLVMERDADGLPLIRARHIKGLLRLALDRAGAWDWFDASSTNVATLLMGGRGDGRPGCLTVGDAVVSPALRSTLSASSGLIDELFIRLPSTAINPETGTALAQHLRTVEAAMPIPLQALVDFDPEDLRNWAGGDVALLAEIRAADAGWRGWISTALAAFDEIGAKRTRGFGALAFAEATS